MFCLVILPIPLIPDFNTAADSDNYNILLNLGEFFQILRNQNAPLLITIWNFLRLRKKKALELTRLFICKRDLFYFRYDLLPLTGSIHEQTLVESSCILPVSGRR